MINVTNETKQAILSTWNAFEGEAVEMCDGSNEIAMELVLDATRLTANGHVDADQEIEDLCNEHGFDAVRSALSKQIELL